MFLCDSRSESCHAGLFDSDGSVYRPLNPNIVIRPEENKTWVVLGSVSNMS